MRSALRAFFFGFAITATILIVVFGGSLIFLNAATLTAPSVDVTLVPVDTASSTSPHMIAVMIENASTTPLNAFELALTFDPTTTYVTAVTPTAALCEERFIILNSVRNTSGTTLLQCGTITPLTGTSTVIANIAFHPRATGTHHFSFATSTGVYAHDGLGTNVTRTRTGLSMLTN